MLNIFAETFHTATRTDPRRSAADMPRSRAKAPRRFSFSLWAEGARGWKDSDTK